jgi:glycosyltransferase involved in cell wall biosynthesis
MMREKMFPSNPEAFIVGSVGKNCTRKQYPRMIDAFAEFAKNKDDVMLLLKVGDPFNRNGQGYDLWEYLQRYGLDKKNQIGFLDQESNLLAGTAHSDLAALYNLFDVHCLTTSGEGFGIPTMESQACGTPNIIADNTTAPELVRNHGWLVPCDDYVMGERNAKRDLINIEKLTEAFQDAYDHPKKIKRFGNESFRYSKEFAWKGIAEKLDIILRKSCDKYASDN